MEGHVFICICSTAKGLRVFHEHPVLIKCLWHSYLTIFNQTISYLSVNSDRLKENFVIIFLGDITDFDC